MDAQLSDTDLAALACSRLCHDLISPVAAVVNGLELFEEEEDDEMRAMAVRMAGASARQASARLQFYRLAFGASGFGEIDMTQAGDVAMAFFAHEKTEFLWKIPGQLRIAADIRLLLNMALTARAAMPRGGRLTLEASDDGLSAQAESSGARWPEETLQIIQGVFPVASLRSRLLHVYYMTRLARRGGFSLACIQKGDAAIIRADAGKAGP